MRILALDSSGLVASVAVVEDGAVDDQVIAEYTVNYKKTHSQTLRPMLDEIVKMTELDLHTVDAIAVAGGPGSFTGLRIGSATAKGLGLALEKPLIHIPTLEGLAYNLCGIADVVCPIMDARRGQVYAGIYEFDGQKLHILEDQMAVPIEELGEKLHNLNRKQKRKMIKNKRNKLRKSMVGVKEEGEEPEDTEEVESEEHKKQARLWEERNRMMDVCALQRLDV